MTRVAGTVAALALVVTVAGCSRVAHGLPQSSPGSASATIAPVVATSGPVAMSPSKPQTSTPPRSVPPSTSSTTSTASAADLSSVLADLNSGGAAAGQASSDVAAGDTAAASGDQP